jgi:hypothetical protein
MASTVALHPAGLVGHARRPDSPATITIIQRSEMQQATASAVSSDAVTSSEYVLTLHRVEELRGEADEEDRPSDYAYDCALKALIETARELSLDFPRASASVGPNRGIRITWSRGNGEVRLVCGGSAANKSYIYSEFGSQHGVDYIVDGVHLAQHLRWALREV